MSRLIDDLLEVTRVTRGKIQLKTSRVSLRDILVNVVEGRTRVAAEKRILIGLDPVETSLLVEGDATRLEQVMDNVLNNGIKFTPEGGRIHITAGREGSLGVIRVKDTDVGIDPSMLESVFDLFTETHQTIDRSQGGLRIGLTGVKTLVELHGGSARAFREGRDRGTEIRISLPLVESQSSSAGVANAAYEAGRARRVLLVEHNRTRPRSWRPICGCRGIRFCWRTMARPGCTWHYSCNTVPTRYVCNKLRLQHLVTPRSVLHTVQLKSLKSSATHNNLVDSTYSKEVPRFGIGNAF